MRLVTQWGKCDFCARFVHSLWGGLCTQTSYSPHWEQTFERIIEEKCKSENIKAYKPLDVVSKATIFLIFIRRKLN